ncbi:hypothetical protein B0J11DRAFT_617637 [Dendryphion nanum]|uniref:Uncharacterized protein n=1 Tax=Dendryphion nanum TaxID=256645 RepID=A0A9P9IDM6_9PLEO|nr:hypothetical protein B0J11DRAFT_617637 [Dendryphion nanum]
MESAYITKAHEHARSAATATYSSSIVTAAVEHESAASAFHNAATDTHNDEALRILKLLEDHHTKLARLIKEPPGKKEKDEGSTTHISEDITGSPPPRAPAARTSSPSATTTRAPSRRRLPQSSIASNLAEKRGIPGARRSAPTSSSVSVTNALATRNEQNSTPVRDMLQRQARKSDEAGRYKDDGPSKATPQKETKKQVDVSPPPDDNFRRFYSAFGGVISAISAPLAFTSLPLNPLSASFRAESPPPSPTKQKAKQRVDPLEASRTIKSSEPDIAALISKPALRALREDQSTPLGPFANNESFYFVPTSGGTVSYASMLRDPQAHPHHVAQDPHLDSIAEGENEGGLRGSSHEEFVDARESVGPPSPTTPRRPRSKGSATTGVTTASTIQAGRGQGLKTMEELQLENDTLRSLIDKQSKRLSMWETTSQSSYNALAQSFRARGSPAALKQQLSDPSALAHALSMGSNATPSLPSPPPIPSIPPQYLSDKQPSSPQPQALSEETTKRIAALESLLASQSAQLDSLTIDKEQLTRQNEKNAQVIGRYREQWEKLKAGARKKEVERRERRIAELRAGAAEAGRDSESGDGTGMGEGDAEGEEGVEGNGVDEAGTFGKA